MLFPRRHKVSALAADSHLWGPLPIKIAKCRKGTASRVQGAAEGAPKRAKGSPRSSKALPKSLKSRSGVALAALFGGTGQPCENMRRHGWIAGRQSLWEASLLIIFGKKRAQGPLRESLQEYMRADTRLDPIMRELGAQRRFKWCPGPSKIPSKCYLRALERQGAAPRGRRGTPRASEG